MKKKILSMALCLCLAAGILPGLVTEARAIGSYGVNLSHSAYQNKYAKPQCTWYCWGRAMEKCGVNLTFGGNAQNWYNNAANTAGFSVGRTPKANSIGVFSKADHIGHVLFVENVQGSTVYYSEGNYDPSSLDGKYHEGTYGVNDTVRYPNTSYEEQLVGYIYLDSSTPSQPDPIAINLGDDFYAGIYYVPGNAYIEAVGGDGSTYMDVRLGAQAASIYTSDPRQIWHFKRYNDCAYKIINEYSGWCLDVAGGQAYNECNIQTWYDDHEGNPQRWCLYADKDDRWYNITSCVSWPNYCLDIYRGLGDPGTNVQLFDRTGWISSTFNVIQQPNYFKPAKPSTPTFRSFSATPDRTVISWNAVPAVNSYDSREYILEIYDTTNSRYVLRNQRVIGTSYALTLPVGSYRAKVQAVNTKYANYKSAWKEQEFTVIPSYTIALTASPAEGGALSGSGSYTSGTYVTLSAVPASGYRFVEWQENGRQVSASANYSFVIAKDRNLKAVFEKIQQSLPDAITGAEADPAAKTVRAVLQNRTAAILTGAVYSKTGQMLDAAMTSVSADGKEAVLRFKTLSAGCAVKLTLLDETTHRPLCGAYQFTS